MNVNPKKKILAIVTTTTIILIGLSANISAAEPVSPSKIPDELIARNIKTHDPSLATSVEAVLYKLKRNQLLTLVLDISSPPSKASGRLIPYAKHVPFLDDTDGSILELRRFIKKNRPFQSIVIFNEAGENYEKAEKIMNRMGIETYHLQGGVVEYQKYLDGLLLSWKPREGRMKTVSNIKPCGEKIKNDFTGSENARKK